MITNDLIINKKLFNPLLNKFVIFCHNYTTIFLVCRILSLIETSYSNYRIIIVVNSSSLYLYFTKIFKGGSTISIYNIGSPSVTLRRPYRIIIEIVTKYRLLAKFKNIVNTNVIFSSKNYVLRDYFVVRVLRRRRSNHFCYIDKFSETIINPNRVEGLRIIKRLKLLVCKIIYGNDLDYYCQGKILFISINDNYLNTFNKIKLKEFDNIQIKNYVKNKISVPYRVIYFDDGFYALDDKIMNQNKFRLLLLDIFKAINKMGIHKDQIGIKYHPSFKRYLPILEYGNEIENFIPAQCLIAKNCKMIFTAFSSVLNTFEKDVIKISIIDLLPWIDKETYQMYKTILTEDRQVSFIPKNIAEFIEIVSKIIITDKAPALPGDSQSLTFPGI